MNEEERQRQMDFILSQQAQFASDIVELKDVVARLADVSLKVFETQDGRIENLETKISALADSQIRTEESLKNLITVVDRYFSEGRNGGPQ